MFTGVQPGDQQGRLEEDQRAGAVLAAAPPHRASPKPTSHGWINPVVRGWMQYYGAFYRSALYPLLTRINAYLMRWLRKKYKRLRGRKKGTGSLDQGRHHEAPVLRPLGLGQHRPRRLVTRTTRAV